MREFFRGKKGSGAPFILWLIIGAALAAFGLFLSAGVGLKYVPLPVGERVGVRGVLFRSADVVIGYWRVFLFLALAITAYLKIEKDIFKKLIPALILSYVLAKIAEKLFFVHTEEIAVTTTFLFSLYASKRIPAWMPVSASAFLLLMVFSGIIAGAYHAASVIAALGIGFIGFSILTLPRKGKTAVAFGGIPAYRKYDLFSLRFAISGEFIKEELKRKSGIKLLDVGCGRGYIKSVCPAEGVDIYGIDFNPQRIEACEALGYKAKLCDLEKDPLPYEKEAFDFAVMCHSLEHLDDTGGALKKIDSCLKKNGVLSIGVPIKIPGLDLLQRAIYGLRHKSGKSRKGETRRFFTLKKFLKFLKKTLPDYDIMDVRGFRIISARHTLPLEDWVWFFKASTWFGRHFPSVTPEVNVVMRKR